MRLDSLLIACLVVFAVSLFFRRSLQGHLGASATQGYRLRSWQRTGRCGGAKVIAVLITDDCDGRGSKLRRSSSPFFTIALVVFGDRHRGTLPCTALLRALRHCRGTTVRRNIRAKLWGTAQ